MFDVDRLISKHIMNWSGKDIVAGGIVMAAVLMFVGTGAIVFPEVTRALTGRGAGPDNVLAAAMTLNIALLLFGWRRYTELRSEVARHQEAEREAKALAITDPLTGCLNRRTINERTADTIADGTARGKSIAYLMLDLDNFKTINDVHGHEAGDLVLREVAKRIISVLPPKALISRLGGDEFACVFIFDPNNRDMVERVAEDVIEKISLPITGPTTQLSITTSIGIATAQGEHDTAEALMRRADIAMYYSKKQGRNCFAWFEQSMHTEIQTRNMIESGLRDGIPRGEFVPYYEQQIDLETGRLVGFEVLARWKSDVLGIVSPDLFIPIAEECGMIAQLSESIMEQAMRDASNWDHSISISINISPVQLRDPWLAQKIVKMLVKTGFPAERLEVEITESCLFENIGLAQSIIGSLKNQGVKIALDDFGTGYSSLSHLRALPFDRIKIDRSFVSTMSSNPESAAIVEAIAQLGRSMKLPITAEGVENMNVIERLRDLGCSKAQGYHYGEPQTIEQTRWMLAERNLIASGQQQVEAKDNMSSEADVTDQTPSPRVGNA